jgi:hypothetical protein
MALLQRRVDGLTARLSEVGADHTELARVGGELASSEWELADAEDRWLRLTDELESR